MEGKSSSYEERLRDHERRRNDKIEVLVHLLNEVYIRESENLGELKECKNGVGKPETSMEGKESPETLPRLNLDRD